MTEAKQKKFTFTMDAQEANAVDAYQRMEAEKSGIRLSATQAVVGLIHLGAGQMPSAYTQREVANGETK